MEGNPAFGLLSGQLLLVSPSDFTPKPVFATMDQSDGAFSSNGSRLAWVQNSTKLWVGDAAGQNAVMLDDVSQAAVLTVIQNPRWSPDGTHLIYQIVPVGHEDQVHVWSSALSGSPTNITSNADASSAEWSPSGTKILFQSVRTGNHDIFSMNPDGSSQTNLSHTTGDQQSPHWSPDGNAVVYSSAFEVWRMNSDGSSPQAITSVTSGVSDVDARWITNQQIVYTHNVSAQASQLYLTSPQGTNQHIFSATTNTVGGQGTPVPSPDGKYIAWSEQDSAQNTQVWLSTVDMPVPVRVTNSGGLNNVALGWRPCP